MGMFFLLIIYCESHSISTYPNRLGKHTSENDKNSKT